MPTITQIGYDEDAYLTALYLTGTTMYAYGQQVLMVVAAQKTTGQQTRMFTAASPHDGQQARLVIAASRAVGLQARATTAVARHVGQQVRATILGSAPHFGFQAKHDTLQHWTMGYLGHQPYLAGPYLAVGGVDAFLRQQVLARISTTRHVGQQVRMVVRAQRQVGQQARLVVNATRHFGQQVNFIRNFAVGAQALMVIYNRTQLRIMYVFPSRGTAALLGDNWSASNQAAGDFLPKNLNTDIEEQVFRSASTDVDLTCDTGIVQGVTITDIAIRNHNLTTSAVVQVQGAQNNLFSPVRTSFNLTVEKRNAYYVAAAFPTDILQQNRYWRFVIEDPTNPAGYVEIGTIIFGNAHIFSAEESFENPIGAGWKHFKDVIPTDGFTNVMNDRALKRWIRLSFKQLLRQHGNYQLLEDFFLAARTSLKALVIPLPVYPSRFAAFAKLAAMPQGAYTNVSDDVDVEYVDLDLEWDESL